MTRPMTLRGAITTLGKDEEIRMLRAEVRRLRRVLKSIASRYEDGLTTLDSYRISRDALRPRMKR